MSDDKLKKHSSSSSEKMARIAKKVNELWSKYDTENSGLVDKIEAQNFVNEVLTSMGQNKMQSVI